ncbi:hypothetical protein [Bacillus cereus]|uniref:hypothetical protein n=1 Tax=Bacillus cereus TaxID=1396 RepID=UPI0020D27D3A|nr:hypothetical protein [Bacillus cereus]
MASGMDPRLFSQYQSDKSTLSNIRYSSSLRGEVLRTENVDAGRKIGFFDIEGRPTSVFEKQDDTSLSQCRERYMYGENEKDAQANNLCGQLVRHYETAGRVQTESFSLDGMPLYQSRQLLKNINKPSNWSADGESTWIDFLDVNTYDTSWKYDVQGKKSIK